MDEAKREMTFQEDSKHYIVSAKLYMANHQPLNGNEATMDYCIAQHGLRVIRKASDLVERQDATIKALTEANRWIPVSERLPGNNEWECRGVLALSNNGFIAIDYIPFSKSVTHWKALPAPPNTDKMEDAK